MGLRCSLTGHNFGESEVEREREERGEEVVVTLREFKTCVRCGEKKTMTENKEVRSLADAGADDDQQVDGADADETPAAESSGGDTPSEPVDADQPAEPVRDAEAETPTAEAGEDDSVPADEDAEILGADSADAERSPPDDTAADTKAGAEGPTADDQSPDDPADDTQAHGSSPEGERADAPDEESAAPPAADDVPEKTDATGSEPDDEEPVTDDAVILDDDDERDTGRAHGEWPEKPEAAEPDDEPAAAWPHEDGEDDGIDATAPTETTDPDVDIEGITGSATDGAVDGSADAGEREEGDAGEKQADPPNEPAAGDESAEASQPGTAESTPDDDAEVIDADPEPPEAVTEGDGFTSAGSAPSPDRRSDREGSGGLLCPECGANLEAKPSLRIGDICPECKRGYLTD